MEATLITGVVSFVLGVLASMLGTFFSSKREIWQQKAKSMEELLFAARAMVRWYDFCYNDEIGPDRYADDYREQRRADFDKAWELIEKFHLVGALHLPSDAVDVLIAANESSPSFDYDGWRGDYYSELGKIWRESLSRLQEIAIKHQKSHLRQFLG